MEKKIILVANVSKEHIRKFHIPIIQKMKAQGWQVDVACRLDAPIPESDHAYDLPCDRNPFGGGIGKSVGILRDILKKEHYDVILCNTITGGIIARVAARPFRAGGTKVFYINHGLHFFKGAAPLRWLLGYPVEKLLAPMTDVMITINEADYQMAKTHLRTGRTVRIHGIGANLQRFRDYRLTQQTREALRQDLGLAQEDFVLTYVAEIIDNKNQQMLIKAFQQVKKNLPQAKMLLVGPEHDEGKVRRMVESFGLGESVKLLGWRDDVPGLLKISDVYVASSKSEGLGLNLIEAMACGLPVVASKNRGHSEIIHHCVNGALVEQDDYRAMADWVLKLAADPALRHSFVEKAQADIEQYETSYVLEELQRIFDLYA